MKTLISAVTILFLVSCSHNKTNDKASQTNFTIAFGSCNNQNLPNDLWREIIKNDPDVWIWGGDNIYADTTDMKLMASYYQKVKDNRAN